MAAIAQPQSEVKVISVWDMSFALVAVNWASDAAQKAALEAIEAVRRFRSSMFDFGATTEPPETFMLDPETAEAELRAYMESQGDDFHHVVIQAAKHFTSPEIRRRTTPLTEAELECLREDDQRALGR